MTGLLRAAYEKKVSSGAIAPDAAQRAAVSSLSRLEADLAKVKPGGWLRKPEGARGVYLWGPVGRGKSMLMDLFFDGAPLAPKQRIHFLDFMARVHRLVNAWRTDDPAARRARFGKARGEDPIPPVADILAREARLICFDEFQVTDIADAMILGRLFEALFARGLTLVATSNRPPDDLYRDGINRQLFLPFITMLKGRMEIVPVGGERDYRTERLRAAGTWFSPVDPDHERTFDDLWRGLLGGEAETGVTLHVLGRHEHWPRAAGGLLRSHFASLCVHALGPEDYLALAGRFHTVFLEHLPQLGPERRNEARRLATLVDTLYEARVRLVVLAAVEPDAIYPVGDQTFEFERTISRLKEMRSAEWVEATARSGP
jgi:cell division protein ZapE